MTRRRTRAWTLAGLAPAALLLGGCQDPTYEAARACSIPSDTVTAILGTDRFTAPEERIEDLPFTALSQTGSGVCRVDAGDDVSLLVRSFIVPAGEAPRRAAAIREGGDSFSLLGGIARADERQGGWACGSVWLTVSVEGDRDHTADPQDLRAAVEAVATEATCYTAAAPS